MAKQIKYGQEARQALKAGAEQLAKAVITTLGPKGRNVAIDKKWGAPSVIHDGVTVAKDIELQDPFENMGAQLVKEAASNTNDKAGDGTTTATLLAYAMIDEGNKLLQEGKNPMVFKQGMDLATEYIVQELSNISKKVSKPEEIEQVATISSANPEVGKIIADLLSEDKMGKSGTIAVEDGSGIGLEQEWTEGMEFDKGYLSHHFANNEEGTEAALLEPAILITDYELSSPGDILSFLQTIVKTQKNIVIIAEKFEGEIFPMFVVNKMKGIFNPLPIKAPAFAERKKEVLEDIAILTGGTVISKETGRTLESITEADLGHADKVWSNAESTRILGGRGDKTKIQERIKQIQAVIKTTKSDFEKEKLNERLAKLSNGVSVIRVGAVSETEMKERKERVIDAVEATKSAIAEGIIAGGGIALLQIANQLNILKGTNDELNAGIGVIQKAIQRPFEQILINAGENVEQIKTNLHRQSNYGYNIETGQYGDMFEMGVIDPAKVTRLAVQNATSVASMVLTTECLITDIPEEDPRPKMM